MLWYHVHRSERDSVLKWSKRWFLWFSCTLLLLHWRISLAFVHRLLELDLNPNSVGASSNHGEYLNKIRQFFVHMCADHSTNNLHMCFSKYSKTSQEPAHGLCEIVCKGRDTEKDFKHDYKVKNWVRNTRRQEHNGRESCGTKFHSSWDGIHLKNVDGRRRTSSRSVAGRLWRGSHKELMR